MTNETYLSSAIAIKVNTEEAPQKMVNPLVTFAITSPNTQRSLQISSARSPGTEHTMSNMSERDKFSKRILVVVCMERFLHITMKTIMFPRSRKEGSKDSLGIPGSRQERMH